VNVTAKYRFNVRPEQDSNLRPTAEEIVCQAALTRPVAGERMSGVPVSDRDRPLVTVRSGTPRARPQPT